MRVTRKLWPCPGKKQPEKSILDEKFLKKMRTRYPENIRKKERNERIQKSGNRV